MLEVQIGRFSRIGFEVVKLSGCIGGFLGQSVLFEESPSVIVSPETRNRDRQQESKQYSAAHPPAQSDRKEVRREQKS